MLPGLTAGPQDLRRIEEANLERVRLRHQDDVRRYEQNVADKESRMKDVSEGWVRAVHEDFGVVVATPTEPYTDQLVSAIPFDEAHIRSWGKCCGALGGMKAELAAKLAAAAVVVPPNAELEIYLARRDMWTVRREKARVPRRRCGRSSKVLVCVAVCVCVLGARAIAQAEATFQFAFTCMANALLKMGLPTERLHSLDEHAWQLPDVVSNFADEMQARARAFVI